MSAAAKAERFRALHRAPPILVLANAWDVVTARLVERRGFPAVATTSAGVAWTLGYPDGERIPRDEMLEFVARIARAVDVPVTADLEAGYGDAGGTARAAWEAGVVGLNLEDRVEAVDVHAERVGAAREAAPGMVINARTDVFLRGTRDVDEAVERSNAYLRAGADCAFVPGVEDAATIERLARGVEGPLSLLALTPSMPAAAELARLGVARVTTGPVLTRVALSAVDAALEELSGRGTFAFAASTVQSSDLNGLLGR
jgi:2-methylisocitrate lyase-like PEP mutase family enzyme